ncbi:MAG: tetratricopeptide repeat protein, partial [Candidatus Nitrotoga sp.]
DEARAAYQLAFNKTDAQSKYRNLIQMKLDALGGAK